MTSPGAPLDLAELQRRVAAILAPVRHPRVGAALALAEETGEVCDLVLKRECYGESLGADELGAELADVLVCVAELADLYGVDLTRAVQRKLDDIEARVPGWRDEFGDALERARRRMD